MLDHDPRVGGRPRAARRPAAAAPGQRVVVARPGHLHYGHYDLEHRSRRGPAGPELRAVIGQRMLIAAGAMRSRPPGSAATLNDFRTFGANLGNLGEYGTADRIFALAEAGARIAGQAADALIAHHPDAKHFST